MRKEFSHWKLLFLRGECELHGKIQTVIGKQNRIVSTALVYQSQLYHDLCSKLFLCLWSSVSFSKIVDYVITELHLSKKKCDLYILYNIKLTLVAVLSMHFHTVVQLLLLSLELFHIPSCNFIPIKDPS